MPAADAARISARLRRFRPSLTLRLKTLANERRAKGLPLFDFGLGETKGELAPRIRDAAKNAYDEGRTMYEDPAGLGELRDAVVRWLGVESQYGRECVVVTTGAKQGLLNLFLAICDPGDTILMEAAPWVSYQPLALAAGATPRAVVASGGEESRFKVSAVDLEREIDGNERVKVFVLNSPVNPTSQVYDAREFAALLEVCVRRHVYLLLDRLYWRIVYDGKSYPEPEITPATREWLIQVDGLSKNFRRTGGMRIGWSVGPEDVSEAMINLQSHYTSGPAVPSQCGALAAISGIYETELRDELEANRNRIYAVRDRLAPVRVWDSEGTFYSFWDVRACFGGRTPVGKVLASSVDVAEYLLDHAGVVTAPGSAFLQEGYLRLSFAMAPGEIDAGLDAAVAAFSELRRTA